MRDRACAVAAWLAGAPTVARGNVGRTGRPEPVAVGRASQGGAFVVRGLAQGSLVPGRLMRTPPLGRTGDAVLGMTTTGPAAGSIRAANLIAPGPAMDAACAISPMRQGPSTMAMLGFSRMGSGRVAGVHLARRRVRPDHDARLAVRGAG